MTLAEWVLKIFCLQGSIGLQWESKKKCWKRGITLQWKVWRKRKKIRVLLFFILIPHIKFQDPMSNHSCPHAKCDPDMHGQAQTIMPPQLLRSWGHKKGTTYTHTHKISYYLFWVSDPFIHLIQLRWNEHKKICIMMCWMVASSPAFNFRLTTTALWHNAPVINPFVTMTHMGPG